MNDKQMMKWLKGSGIIQPGITIFRFWTYNKFKMKMQVVCAVAVAMGKGSIERHLETHEHTQKPCRIIYAS